MSLAEKLAKSVLRAQVNMILVRTQTIAELTEQRDKLRHLCGMAIDLNQLQRQRLELNRTLKTAALEIEGLKAERDQESTLLSEELQAAWDQLNETYNTKLKENYAKQIIWEFYDALDAFALDLKERGIEIEHATPAQLRKQLPTLVRIAASIRTRAESSAVEASKRLEESSDLRQQYDTLRQEQHQIEQQWDDLLRALRQHYRSGETGIIVDLGAMDKGTAKRLRQEILAPKLNDARIEREKGLTDADPLREIEALISRP